LLTLGVAQLMIVDTDPARAEHVAANLTERFGEGRAAAPRDLAAALSEADGLINATPVGMAKTRVCHCRPSCCGIISGSRTSFTFRWRPSC
jgi:shikimate 5-dehydrogenase